MNIEFSCPHCSHIIETSDELLGTEVDCPGCGKKVLLFYEHAKIPQPEPEPLLPPLARQQKIRRQAVVLEGIAALFVMGGLFLIILFFLSPEMGIPNLSWISGALLGAALWFYLLAQIVHIRANTEK
jgi:DNA-directed RNA polymerase subunit RPC12/RpoP